MKYDSLIYFHIKAGQLDFFYPFHFIFNPIYPVDDIINDIKLSVFDSTVLNHIIVYKLFEMNDIILTALDITMLI